MRKLLLIVSTFIFLKAGAQKLVVADTIFGSGDPLVVTATRLAGKSSRAPLPITVITAQEIRKTGLLRLQDILQEQTGVAIINAPLGNALNGYPNPFGQGIQLMGLDPAYTLILLDGEPLVGRNAGILNTGRIATGDIQQVEIVKGPASSLYGSEAMAGVINILTQKPDNNSLNAQLFTGSQATRSGSLSVTQKNTKSSLHLFAHQYSSGGYDLDPQTWGKTQDPFRILSGNVKWIYEPRPRHQITLSVRLNNNVQNNRYQVQSISQPEIVSGQTKDNDFTAFLQWRYQLAGRGRLTFRSFLNAYSNASFVQWEKTGALFDAIDFRQQMLKQEVEYQLPRKSGGQLLALAGWSTDQVIATRYANQPPLSSFFASLQEEWKLMKNKLTLHVGGRIDKREDFAARLSPRMAVAWYPADRWKITASIGGGFKAPDFRHMYLNFSNSQIGYSLVGAAAIGNELLRMQQLGLLQAGADITPYQAAAGLRPEYGTGLHVSARYASSASSLRAGVFYNRINGQIDLFSLPFTRNNGLPIYSYYNAGNIFSRGIEIEGQVRLSKYFSLQVGYQYLEAKDLQVLRAIDAKSLYRRDPVTYVTTLLTRNQYVGLPNRSKHMGQIKWMFEQPAAGRFAYLRVMYRSAFGWMDINGNRVIDDPREMAEGFFMANLSVSQRINSHFSLQGGIENILNYTHPQYAPHLPGRQWTLSVIFQVKSNQPSN